MYFHEKKKGGEEVVTCKCNSYQNLLDVYETLHYTVVIHYLQMCGNMVYVKNLKGEIIQLILARENWEVYLVSATPPKWHMGIFIKLYSVVVQYLQMCMKEYGCCPRFGRQIIQLKLSQKRRLGSRLWEIMGIFSELRPQF